MKSKKLLFIIPILLITLSGCGVDANHTVGPNDVDSIWNFVVYIFSVSMIWLGRLLGNNIIYGLIAITLLFRGMMVPMYKKQIVSQEAMTKVQPEVKKIQDKYAGKTDNESKMKMNQEMQSIYKRHGVNPLAGCLPLLLQMPLLFAFYDAIQNLLIYDGLDKYANTSDMSTSFLLWNDMGERVIVFAILAALTTWYSTVLSSAGQDPNASGAAMMKQMSIIMPIMILFMGFSLPGALSLYWVLSNGVTIIQTLVLKRDKIAAAREQKRIDKMSKK